MEKAVEAVYEQARKLDKDGQLTLLERLATLIRKSSAPSQGGGLLSLSGLGAELWRGDNIDDYLNEERAW